MVKEDTFTWKDWLFITLVFVILIGGVLWFFISLERGNNDRDKIYEELCSEKGLELYKSSENAPHYSKCYEIDNGILRFYYAHNFKGKWYLREGLH